MSVKCTFNRLEAIGRAAQQLRNADRLTPDTESLLREFAAATSDLIDHYVAMRRIALTFIAIDVALLIAFGGAMAWR